jgi:hypothetical protein
MQLSNIRHEQTIRRCIPTSARVKTNVRWQASDLQVSPNRFFHCINETNEQIDTRIDKITARSNLDLSSLDW